MIYLLDTNVVSLLVREDPIVVRKLAELTPADQVRLPVIVLGEVLFGLQRLPAGRRWEELQRKFDGLLSGIGIEDLPENIAAQYAAVKVHTQQHGKPIGDNDCWIAAMTLLIGATLVSRDGDYSAVPGLPHVTWEK